MADTAALKNRIRAAIKANDNQEITGPVLQQALLDMVDELNGATETEASQRQNGDSTLQQGINTERQQRQDADTVLGQRITEEIQQERQRAEEAFDDLDMIDAAGSEVSPAAIDLTLRKNDGSEVNPEWRTLCHLLIPSATNQRAGLMSAAMRNLLYNLRNAGYAFGGIAVTSTNPGVPSGNCFYIVRGAGTYTHFKNADNESIVLSVDGIYVLTYESVENQYWEWNLIIGIDNNISKNNHIITGEAVINEFSRLCQSVYGQFIRKTNLVASGGLVKTIGGFSGYIIYVPKNILKINYDIIDLSSVAPPAIFDHYPVLGDTFSSTANLDTVNKKITLSSNQNGVYLLVNVRDSLNPGDLGYFSSSIDSTPTSGSNVPVSSNGVKTYVDNYIELIGILREIDSSGSVNGHFIDAMGVYSNNDAYSISKVYSVTAGTKISVKATGYNQNVAIIAKVVNNTYTPLVISIDTTNRTYEYTMLENCNIVFSYRTSDSLSGYYKEDYDERFEQIEQEIQNLPSEITKKELSLSDRTTGKAVIYNSNTQTYGVTVNSAFSMLEHVSLAAGAKIKMKAAGYNGNPNTLVMIAKEVTGGYQGLVLSVSGYLSEYEYTVAENMKVTFSFETKNNLSNTHIYVTYGSVSEEIELALEEAKDYSDANLEEAKDYADNVVKGEYGVGNIFPKIAVIGDSLSSGQLEKVGGSSWGDVYGISWLSSLARKMNCVSRNHYSEAGLTAEMWIKGTGYAAGKDYLGKLQSDAAFNAYFIAMGTNDIGASYPLGTISDEAMTDSFVGYYKAIIEAVKTKAPNAAIFCVGLYQGSTAYNNYSNMIRQISELYDLCYYIDYVGNCGGSAYWHTGTAAVNNGIAIGFHFSTCGYNYAASVIHKCISDIVNSNRNDFLEFGEYNNAGTKYDV